jgi:hypothetical protein
MKLVAWLSGRKTSSMEFDTTVAEIELPESVLANILFCEDQSEHVDDVFCTAVDLDSSELFKFCRDASRYSDWVEWVDRPQVVE